MANSTAPRGKQAIIAEAELYAERFSRRKIFNVGELSANGAILIHRNFSAKMNVGAQHLSSGVLVKL